MWPRRPGPRARAYSSWKITCCVSEAPRPPHSRGQPMQAQPACPSRRSQARRSSTSAFSLPGPPAPRSARELAAELALEPAGDLAPEGLVFVAEVQVHGVLILARGSYDTIRTVCNEPARPLEARTIPALARAAAARFGEARRRRGRRRPALLRGLWSAALRASRAFLAAGVAPGDRVAIWAPNLHEWIVAALGLQGAGGVLVPINTRWKGARGGLRPAKVSGASALHGGRVPRHALSRAARGRGAPRARGDRVPARRGRRHARLARLPRARRRRPRGARRWRAPTRSRRTRSPICSSPRAPRAGPRA